MKFKKKTKGLLLALVVLAVMSVLLVLFLSQKDSKKARTGNIADIEWYDEETKEFTLTTVDQLYEFAELSYFYTFEGQTVKLGADMIVNEGNAEDWAKNAPKNKWFAIDGFAGTFDGQGHTISGLYTKAHATGVGLFCNTQKSCVIRDFKLVNSYFKASGGKGVGTISSSGAGTFEKIYSDAIVVSEGQNSGGIIGRAKSDTNIRECWYDGTISSINRTVGGMVATVTFGETNIEHCLNTAELISTYTDKSARVAGLCGTVMQTGTKLNIKDSFNAGFINSENQTQVASVLGLVDSYAIVTVEDTFATTESHATTIHSVFDNGELYGGGIDVPEQKLIGNGGYEWTNLDFSNYWTTVADGTPILQYFAEEVASTEGLTKKFSFDWHDENASEYTLSTKEELWGFAMLSATTTFEGKTIKLGADIAINEGDASKWAKKAPHEVWAPIRKFGGAFDGQGHTISGLYKSTDGQFVGMFARTTAESTIKNFKLENSFFKSTKTGEACVGGVVGLGLGTVDSVYSSAIVEGSGYGIGGIIGWMNGEHQKNVINCWFDGTVTMDEDARYGGGIVGVINRGSLVMEHCLNTGTITTAKADAAPNVAGLLGSAIEHKDGVTIKITDCLNSGDIITTGSKTYVASIVGNIQKNVTATIQTTYATTESNELTIGGEGAKTVNGGVVVFDEAKLIGDGGYQWTSLDFANYWTTVSDGTPILKCFGAKVRSTAGLKKLFDTSWYNSRANEFVITTAEQLYGFYMISSQTDFAGKTVKLGANITVNSGNTAEWATNAPALTWNPIQEFAGTFDGQGYTISGLYTSTDKQFVGMFTRTTKDSTIKNFRLENSFFKSTKTGEALVGSVVGLGQGTVESVYSNALVEGSGYGIGGIIGWMNGEHQKNVSNCWFDGTVTMDESARYGGGIVGVINRGSLVMEHCLNTGTITTAKADAAPNVAGLLGAAMDHKDGVSISIADSLNTGDIITTGSKTYVASVVGNIQKNVTATIQTTYATKESNNVAVGGEGAKSVKGSVLVFDETALTGDGGYQWTYLDFDKYWTTVKSPDGTPILRSFAGISQSVVGLEKIYDISWYNSTDKTFVIKDAKQLYGLAIVADSDNFAGKTVKLGKNITVNSGNAAEWATNAPALTWNPIQEFAGTFDGQGYTISGLYTSTDKQFVGMFTRTTKDSTIKNFRLENSFFKSTKTGEALVGSVVGLGQGTVESIYSNAIIEGSGYGIGGIVGWMNGEHQKNVSNCWFDGTVTMDESARYGGGIVGIINRGSLVMEHCLNTGTITTAKADAAPNVAGLLGAAMEHKDGVAIKITDSLNTGDIITTGSKTYVTSVVGNIQKNVTATIQTTYATTESNAEAVGGEGAKSIEGNGVEQYSKSALEGEGGYINTQLAFDKEDTEAAFDGWWVVKEDQTPELKSFVTGQVLDLSDAVRPDTSWYYSDPTATSYTIYNKAQFVGFRLLVNSGVLTTQTVYLGADIVVNDVDSVKDVVSAGNADTLYNWTPIGTSSNPFKGTFDGKDPKTQKIHTISGIYCNSAGNTGLFGYTSGGTIQNLKLKNTYIYSTGDLNGSIACRGDNASEFKTIYIGKDVTVDVAGSGKVAHGGIVGQVRNGATIQNCWFAGSVKLTGGAYYGGGILGGAFSGTVNIEDCLNTGTISCKNPSSAPRVGGFCGLNQTTLNITDSLSVAEIDVNAHNYVGSLLGISMNNSITNFVDTYATNQYTHGVSNEKVAIGYLWDASKKAIMSGSIRGTVKIDGTAITQAQDVQLLKNKEDIKGEKAYLNTALQFDNPTTSERFDGCWMAVEVQSTKEGKTPVLRVFADELATGEVEKDLNGLYVVDTSWYTRNTTATSYAIYTVEELLGFVTLVNNGTLTNQTIQLGNDIIVNDVDSVKDVVAAENADTLYNWTPIGTSSNPFKGTFDGKDPKTQKIHTISGIYCNSAGNTGLFGYTSGGKIQNLKLKNTYIYSTGDLNGSIACRGDNASEFNTIYIGKDVMVDAVGSGKAAHGGIVGQVRNGATIQNCWFAGSVKLTGGAYYGGGILGGAFSGTVNIKDCLNTGTISCKDPSSAPRVGGFCGLNQTTLNITDSLSVAEIDVNAHNYVGSLLGISMNNSITNFVDTYATNQYTHGDSKEKVAIGYLWDASKNAIMSDSNRGTVKIDGTVITQAQEEQLLKNVEDIKGDKVYLQSFKDEVISN